MLENITFKDDATAITPLLELNAFDDNLNLTPQPSTSGGTKRKLEEKRTDKGDSHPQKRRVVAVKKKHKRNAD
jgi:hypothetical protein